MIEPAVQSRSSTDTFEAPSAVAHPLGATLHEEGVIYRVWAPGHQRVRVALGGNGQLVSFLAMDRVEDGYFVAHDRHGKAGDFYRFFLDEQTMLPDVASRYQPFGVFGPSMVIDPHSYGWKARHWVRPFLRDRVIYGLHVGAFTTAGTFRAAIERLDHLAELGVNTIELMSLADFPGRWSSAGDGVMLFAPARCYGHPDDLRALIDAAHERGLAVAAEMNFDDVGPSGNHFDLYTTHYLQRPNKADGRRRFNLDGERSAFVRQFLLSCAMYWLDEFRLDGLRLSVGDAECDEPARRLYAEITRRAHDRGAFTIGPQTQTSAESGNQASGREALFDAVSAEDIGGTVTLALERKSTGIGRNHGGVAGELIRNFQSPSSDNGEAFAEGRADWTQSRQPLTAERRIWSICNPRETTRHPEGERLNRLISLEDYRAVSMLLCLSPQTPYLFMGQEWGASSPFPLFSDQPGGSSEAISEPLAAAAKSASSLNSVRLVPKGRDGFSAAKLRWEEVFDPRHLGLLSLYRECLGFRATLEAFKNPASDHWVMKQLGENSLGLRWRDEGGDWLLLFWLDNPDEMPWDSDLLVQPSGDRRWAVIAHSNEPRFGGTIAPLNLTSVFSQKTPGLAGACLLRER